jgi:Mg-chelatase subunit ChlD
MNPESPTPREQLEARLTALLLGELSEDEAAALREIIARDARLAALHARLKETIDLVREAAVVPAEMTEEKPAPVRLGEERRQKLLAQFKTVTPKEFAPKRPPRNLWIFALQAAAVVALLACFSSLLLPALSESKAKSQPMAVLSNLRQIDAAKQLWAEENNKGSQDTPTVQELAPYLGRGSDGNLPKTSLGESYIIGNVGESPRAELDANKARSFGGRQIVMLPSKDAGKQEIALADDVRQLAESRTTPRSESLAAPQPNSAGPIAAVPAPTSPPEPDTGSIQPQEMGPTAKNTIVLPQAAPVELAVTDTEKTPDLQLRDNYGLASSQEKEKKSEVPVMAFDDSPPANNAKKATDMNGQTGNWGLADGSVQKGSTGAFHTYAGNAPGSPAGQLATIPPTAPAWTDLAIKDRQLPESLASAQAPTPAGDGVVVFANSGPTITFQNGGTIPANGAFDGFSGGGGGGDARRPATAPNQKAAGEQQVETLAETTPAAPALLAPTVPVSADANASSVDNSGTLVAVDESVRRQADFVKAGKVNQQGISQEAGQNPLMARSQTVQENMLGEPVSNTQSGTPGYDAETHSAVVTTESGRSVTNWGLAQSDSSTAPATWPLRKAFINGPDPGRPIPQITPPPSSSNRSLMYAASSFKFAAQNDSTAGKPSDAVSVGMLYSTNTSAAEDQPLPKLAVAAPVPQPEILVRENAFSTFSLNVSDVSFKLAAASLEHGVMPDAVSIRSEEFINAFDYRDPDPAPGAPIGFAWERAHDPFAHNRDFLRFSVKTAAAGRQPGRPLNLVLLLDNSGSMERADRVAIIHEALRVLAAQLQSQDTISVVTFARTSRLWVDGIPGTQAGQVLETVGSLTPEGGTDLGDALDLAYATAHRHYLANGVNRVVLLTDGAANLGNVDPATLKATVEAQRKQGIALDCFGIGWEGYNDDLLEVLTRNGDGRYGFINTPEEAASGFAAQLAGALHVAASDVKVQVEFNPTRVVSYRQIGYAKHQLTKEQFRDNSVNAAQIGAAEAGNALYTVEVNPQGTGPICTVHVRYRDPGTADYYEHAWDVPYTGSAVVLDQASPAMRLAATASAFSEWLSSSPYAAEVTPNALLDYLRGVPAVYGVDTRPAQLETMIHEAKSLTGK